MGETLAPEIASAFAAAAAAAADAASKVAAAVLPQDAYSTILAAVGAALRTAAIVALPAATWSCETVADIAGPFAEAAAITS